MKFRIRQSKLTEHETEAWLELAIDGSLHFRLLSPNGGIHSIVSLETDGTLFHYHGLPACLGLKLTSEGYIIGACRALQYSSTK